VRVLFQLDFEHPSQHVTRGLAWALMGQKKLDQAEREYEKLLETEPAPIDYLNAGYCQWLKGNIRKAVKMFSTFIKLQQEAGNKVDLREEMMKDQALLRAYAISDIDMGIMCDMVAE
jgi:tetratricopeptide (TPR) repeat protein